MSADPYSEVNVEVVKEEDKPEDANRETQGRPQYQRRGPYNRPVIGQELVILTDKIVLPVEQFPRYNFVGKLLGPKGINLKAMQSFAKVKMSIKGKDSHKDRSKEEELIASGDPQYEHLKEPLHVIISTKAPRIEAHRRLAAACRELNKFMGPVNEEMSQQEGGGDIGEGGSSGREIVLPAAPAPQIMFGVPPPGAIILNENPTFGQTRVTHERKSPRESYTYRKTSENRSGDKRSSSSSSFPLKRFKQDSYSQGSYTSR